MYAIQNKRTKKFVYGTDFRHWPPTQRTSFDAALLFEDNQAAHEFRHRNCGKDYRIVKVKIIVEEEVRQ